MVKLPVPYDAGARIHPGLPCLLFSLLLLVSGSAWAADLLVPENYSLEDALELAQPGDVVSVAAGTLDGLHGSASPLSLPDGIIFKSRIPGANRIEWMALQDLPEGVTIEGFLFGFDAWLLDMEFPHGVKVLNASVHFVGCRFQRMTPYGARGGFEVEDPQDLYPIGISTDSTVLFENCYFHRNATGGNYHGVAGSADCVISRLGEGGGWLRFVACTFQEQASPINASVPVEVIDSQFLDCLSYLITARAGLVMEGCLVADFSMWPWGDCAYQYGECYGYTKTITITGPAQIHRNTFVDTEMEPGFLACCPQPDPEEIAAVIVLGPSSTGEITHNLFISQPAAAVDAPGAVTVACNDAWQSGDMNWRGGIGDVTGINGNISEAPLFCSRANGDYTLSIHSPAGAENNDCGQMGAFETACETTPVLVRSFTAKRIGDGVELRWSVSEEAEVFVQRIDAGSAREVHRAFEANGAYLDEQAPWNEVRYGLGVVLDGQEVFPIAWTTVAASDTPVRSSLIGAFPNPSNPITEIRFVLDSAQAPTLRIYDTAGRLVRTFPPQAFPVGESSIVWNGKDDAGHSVASGVYVTQLITSSRTDAKACTLLK